MPTTGETVYSSWRVIDSAGAFKTGLTGADFDIRLTDDNANAAEAVSTVEIASGVYVFSFAPTTASIYNLSVQEKNTFALSNQSGFAGREWGVVTIGSWVTRVSAAIHAAWRVIDLTTAFVNGLTSADFDIRLTKNGASTGETVTVLGLGNGIYTFSFTPAAVGFYSLAVQEKNTFANSAQNGFAGRNWDVEAAVSVAGTDLAVLAAKPQFTITKIPVKETTEKRSRDYVWQAATISNPTGIYGWNVEWLGKSAAERDAALQHYLDNKGTTFPWTNPDDSVVYQVRYDPEDIPEFDRNTPNECRWHYKLLPAVT